MRVTPNWYGASPFQKDDRALVDGVVRRRGVVLPEISQAVRLSRQIASRHGTQTACGHQAVHIPVLRVGRSPLPSGRLPEPLVEPPDRAHIDPNRSLQMMAQDR